MYFRGRAWSRDESSGFQEEFVTPGYFETVSLPPVHGRSIGTQDHPNGRKGAVLSEAAARCVFGPVRRARWR